MANNINKNGKSDNLSRHVLLSWVNECLEAEFGKIEELCTGDAYCQIMDILFPGSVPMKRVKFCLNRDDQYSCVENFKLLKNSFHKMNVHKTVPINDLIKGSFTHNYHFLQWFKKFYEANYNGQKYDALIARGGIRLGNGTGSAANNRGVRRVVESKSFYNKRAISKVRVITTRSAPALPKETTGSAKKAKVNNDIMELSDNITNISSKLNSLERERDLYYSKLRDIEILCKDGGDNKLIQKIFDVLYATEDGFAPPDENPSEEEEQEH